MEETTGRNSDSGPSKTDDRTGRKHERDPRSLPETREKEDSGLRINEPGQIRQRIGNETESRFWEHVRRTTNLDWGRSESSPYPIRPGVKDCTHYLRCGWCSFGSNCHFNHPPTHHAQVLRERIRLPNCKYFVDGFCNFGSSCVYPHSKETGRQATTPGWGFDGRRHETESSSMAEKRACSRTIPDSQEVVQEQRERQNIWSQGRQGHEDARRDNTEESVEERRWRERHGGALEEQRLRDIQRREARLRLDQMRPTVEFNEADRTTELLLELSDEAELRATPK